MQNLRNAFNAADLFFMSFAMLLCVVIMTLGFMAGSPVTVAREWLYFGSLTACVVFFIAGLLVAFKK